MNCGWTPPQIQQPQAPYRWEAAADEPTGPSGPLRLFLIIAPITLAVALLAAAAVFFVPRLLHPAPDPAPQPVSTSSAPSPTTQPPPKPSPTKPAPTKPATTKPPTTDYAKLGPKVSSGILTIIATGCPTGGSRIGSAFLISNRTAVASLSSLAGATVVGLTNGTDTFAAKVSGADREHGIVILKLDHPASGHVFAVDSAAFAVGESVGTFGIPTSGGKPKLTQSTVDSANAQLQIGGNQVRDVASTPAVVDPGLSGGPTLAANGDANGMVILDESGKMMVVPGELIKSAIAKGTGSLPAAGCQNPLGPKLIVIAGAPTDATKSLFGQYFGGIDSGDYQSAFSQLSPRLQAAGYKNYVQGWATSYDFNVVVHQATGSGAQVTFDSIFSKGKGPKGTNTCARWDIDYQFVTENGGPKINKALPHSGPIFRKC